MALMAALSAAGVALAFGLDALLQEIQMNGQRVGAHHRDRTLDILERKRRRFALCHELWRADVADDHGRRRLLADDGIGIGKVGATQRGAL